MKVAVRIFDNVEQRYVDNDQDALMDAAGIDRGMRFEDYAMQSDGTLIVCDKCGNFGYLDYKRYELKVMVECAD